MLHVVFVLTWLSVLAIQGTNSGYLLVALDSLSVDIPTLPGPETNSPRSYERGKYVVFTLLTLYDMALERL